VKHSVEVAHLVNGEAVSIRTLSLRSGRRAGALAAAMVLALACGGALALAAGLWLGHRIVHGPAFLALWSALATALALVAAARARARAHRYTIGVGIDDDAYAPLAETLVRPSPGGWELGLSPGMAGTIESARGPVSVESLVRASAGEGRARMPLELGARAELTLGRTTFIVRGLPAGSERVVLPAAFWRPFARRALLPIQVAAVATVLCTVPQGTLLGEREMRSAIPADATPWEVEKLLRQEAQSQAATLHACFDPLPLACQHPGYVGVGLSLTRQGEIRSSWIARSTFGQDCPVDACMSNVVAGWFFEPLPEPLRIVLPVQVLRTGRPLPEPLGLGPAGGAGPRGLAWNGSPPDGLDSR
jgi:hypothetical protein